MENYKQNNRLMSNENKDDEFRLGGAILPDVGVDRTRTLEIIVWGKAYHKKCMPRNLTKRNNFSVAMWQDHRRGGLPAKKSDETLRNVQRNSGFKSRMQQILESIELNNFNVIGVNCIKGKHRSQACAITLKRYYYPNAVIVYLDN